jgi:hypothetical protein
MAASTAWRLSSDTLAVPFRIRETVLGDTPAWRATSIKVDGPEEWEVSAKVLPVDVVMKTFSQKVTINSSPVRQFEYSWQIDFLQVAVFNEKAA